MGRLHEHYTAGHKDLPPNHLLFRALRIVIPFLLVLLPQVGTDPRGDLIPAARISLGDDLRTRDLLFSEPAHMRFRPFLARDPRRVLYLDANLAVTHERSFTNTELFSAGDGGYAVYRKVADTVQFHGTDGRRLFELKTATYPRTFRSGEYFPIFIGDQSGLGFVDRAGKQAGPFQYFTSLVIAYDYAPAEKAAYLGFLDGTVEKFRIDEGKALWRTPETGAGLPIVKGLGLSPDQQAVALVEGVQPERFTLLDKDGNRLWSVATGGDLRSAVHAAAGARYCFGHTARIAYLLDRRNGSVVHAAVPAIPPRTRIKHASFDNPAPGRLAAFSFSYDGLTEVRVVDGDGRLVFLEVFAAPYAMVRVADTGRAFLVHVGKAVSVYAIPFPIEES